MHKCPPSTAAKVGTLLHYFNKYYAIFSAYAFHATAVSNCKLFIVSTKDLKEIFHLFYVLDHLPHGDQRSDPTASEVENTPP